MIDKLIEIIAGLIHEMREERRSDKQIEHQLHKIMTALESLTAAVTASTVAQTDLITAVNAAVVRIGTVGPTDAQLNSLTTQIQANADSDVALVKSINDALAATPVVPTPTPTP